MMTAKISLRIHVGVGLSASDLLSELREHNDELVDILVDDLSHHNARATYSNDSLTLEDVEKGEGRGGYTLRYNYGWEAYWGCKDMNDGGIESEESRFRYWGGYAIFTRVVIEKRDTRDEF
jgi:hypothetical protein